MSQAAFAQGLSALLADCKATPALQAFAARRCCLLQPSFFALLQPVAVKEVQLCISQCGKGDEELNRDTEEGTSTSFSAQCP